MDFLNMALSDFDKALEIEPNNTVPMWYALDACIKGWIIDRFEKNDGQKKEWANRATKYIKMILRHNTDWEKSYKENKGETDIPYFTIICSMMPDVDRDNTEDYISFSEKMEKNK